ncbi:MAG: acyl-CoA thioesterase [Fidelibacterota bacterium]|nr:MAG: acyl-CoA thioesterase [Candidatus Neomarinimicrobiota bacterium]
MPTEQRRPFEIELTFEAKTYDVDFAGIVSNIVYFRWLEDLRLKVLDEYLPLDGLLEQGISPVLVRTEIDYKRAVRLFDKPIGRMWMSYTGRRKFVLTAEFTVDGEVVTTAEHVCVFVNLKNWRTIPLPEKLALPPAKES